MGTINVAASAGEVAAHFTLEANVVTTVVFDGDLDRVEVISRDGAAGIWYTADGSDPVRLGRRSYVLPAGAVGSDERQTGIGGLSIIKLLSAGTPAVSVQMAA